MYVIILTNIYYTILGISLRRHINLSNGKLFVQRRFNFLNATITQSQQPFGRINRFQRFKQSISNIFYRSNTHISSSSTAVTLPSSVESLFKLLKKPSIPQVLLEVGLPLSLYTAQRMYKHLNMPSLQLSPIGRLRLRYALLLTGLAVIGRACNVLLPFICPLTIEHLTGFDSKICGLLPRDMLLAVDGRPVAHASIGKVQAALDDGEVSYLLVLAVVYSIFINNHTHCFNRLVAWSSF